MELKAISRLKKQAQGGNPSFCLVQEEVSNVFLMRVTVLNLRTKRRLYFHIPEKGVEKMMRLILSLNKGGYPRKEILLDKKRQEGREMILLAEISYVVAGKSI